MFTHRLLLLAALVAPVWGQLTPMDSVFAGLSAGPVSLRINPRAETWLRLRR